jgi:serine/threonine protein phosphatase 1
MVSSIMTARTFAIGDIHGHLDALTALIDSLDLQEDDRLVFLGDFVDKGPDSKGVLDYLINLEKKHDCVFIRGNHEEWMLYGLDTPKDQAESEKLEYFWVKHGGGKTLSSYGAEDCATFRENIPDSHRQFLENTVTAYETESHVFVHAGWDSDKTMDEQERRTLRYRFLSEATPDPAFGKEIICGHSAMQNGHPAAKGNITCVDTIEGGWLTAYDITNSVYYQADKQGQTRKIAQAEEFCNEKHVPEFVWKITPEQDNKDKARKPQNRNKRFRS